MKQAFSHTKTIRNFGEFALCSSVKEKVLTAQALTHKADNLYRDYVANIALKNCSFCKSIIHRKASSYNSDRLIMTDIRFICIFELISTSTQL